MTGEGLESGAKYAQAIILACVSRDTPDPV